MKKAKVFIVDDHPIVRQGLIQLINQETDLIVCGQADTVTAAMEKIDAVKPDIAIVDISLEGRSGIDLIKEVAVKPKALPVLVLSMHDEQLYAERALRAGAKGYVMKEEAPQKLLEAIRQILKGEIYVSKQVNTMLLRRISKEDGALHGSPVEILSDRELEVFQMIGQGKSTRQIAEQLNLSVKTIETYRSHIMEKLDLSNARELVQYAVQFLQTNL